jgi:ATP-binding cassette subfamily B protein
MNILWKYLRPHQSLLWLALALAAAGQVLQLIDPIIFGKIIDEYALNPGDKPADQLVVGALRWLGIAVAIALLARLFQAFTEYVTRLIVQKFGMDIFNEGLRHTLRLPYHEFEETSSGQVVSALQKVRSDNERFITAFINVLFTALVGVAFLVWYSITKHWALIPVFLIGLVLLGGLTSILSRKIKSLQRSVLVQTNILSGAITESLRNIELVKSMGLTFPEIRRLRGFTERIFNLEMNKVRKVRALQFLQGATLLFLKESILFLLLWLIFHKLLSPGELISMQFISQRIIFPLQELGNIILAFREAQASLQIFDELMKKEPEYRPEEPVELGDIESLRFEKVGFTYRKATQKAVEDLSFSVHRGETIAFVGPSGSGKSTLVKLLVGLYMPTEGMIYYDEIPARDIRYNRVRKQLGFVTQETQLFSGTIGENMRFVKPDATDEEIYQALEKAAALKIVQGTERGLDTILGENGKKLSGGERQRLAIARALLRNPRILIFDEATSALDSITEEGITQTVKDIAEAGGQITILIAHRLSTIMYANRIYVLEKGSIVEWGTHEALVEKKGLYYAMWRQQIGERKDLPAVLVSQDTTDVDLDETEV